MEQLTLPNQVKRTERGWAAHFICANRCRFRRNTLLEHNQTRIVVSSVGLMEAMQSDEFETIGYGRYFETMAFYAQFDGRYWDADVCREVEFDSPWMIDEIDADDRANDQHEAVVSELANKLAAGLFENTSSENDFDV